MADSAGRVYLVGAGPGDPGLLTLRGLECLRLANVILYDRLVPTRLLDFAPPEAECVCLTDLGTHRPERWPLLLERMIACARAGKVVVRLKGGDPFVFARGGEEAQALREAGIDYEIVPGVTAALAAAAYAEIPVTHRAGASNVTFVTGHECPGKGSPGVDWARIAALPGTVVLYMGMTRLAEIVQALKSHGKPGATPVAVVENASRGDQRTLQSTLEKLPEAVQRSGMHAPSLVILGEVVKLRPEESWAERRPLQGQRILIARPGEQGTALVAPSRCPGRGVLAGARARHCPTRFLDAGGRCHRSPCRFRLASVHERQRRSCICRAPWTTKKGPARRWAEVRLAAIGTATAGALGSYHLNADLVPGEFVSEALAAELLPHVQGGSVLLVRAEQGREILLRTLESAARVRQIAVYRQEPNHHLKQALREAWTPAPPDFILLTSSNIAHALLQALDASQLATIRQGKTKLVSISQVTTRAVCEHDLTVAGEATPHTMDGIVALLEKLARG